MSEHVLPRYPVYIPTKGRSDTSKTAHVLDRERCPFSLVVEPHEVDAYAAVVGAARVLTLPFANRGSSTPARNWIKQHAREHEQARHWVLDDNIVGACRLYRGRRVKAPLRVALRVVEDFVDRYENVALAGLNYRFFALPRKDLPPYYLNVHVYSCILVLTSLTQEWRPKYNEDTDLCLQVLSDGWCTVLVNAFAIDKIGTMVVKGGNTPMYQGDGRLQMARSLERDWPGVVSVSRRFNRPQHVVRDAWRKFDTPLRKRADVDVAALPAVDDYGLRLVPR